TVAALLKAMNEDCRSQGSEFMVLRLPGPNGYDNKMESKCLKEAASSLGVPFLDLNQPFRKHIRAGEKLFYLFHTNAQGHRIIADELYSALSSGKR
ncbi:MAG: hypothetical protein K2Z81_26640, partial [Cyanobacteria bacterium]|nr:hypothetical protein [Cyanobacteriota bacterium]